MTLLAILLSDSAGLSSGEIAGISAGGGSGLLIIIKWFLFDKKSSDDNSTKHALMNQRIEQLEKEKEKMTTEFKTELMAAKNSRSAIRKKAEEELKYKTDVLHNRVDKTQKKMEDYATKIDLEMKTLHTVIGEVKSSNGVINGKLDILLRQKGLS